MYLHAVHIGSNQHFENVERRLGHSPWKPHGPYLTYDGQADITGMNLRIQVGYAHGVQSLTYDFLPTRYPGCYSSWSSFMWG